MEAEGVGTGGERGVEAEGERGVGARRERGVEAEGERGVGARGERGVEAEGERGAGRETTGLGTAFTTDCEVLLQRDLTEAQKLELVLNFSKYSPCSTFVFPMTVEYGKKWSFQDCYLKMYPWLGYSIKLDACLCLPCSLFNVESDASMNFARKPVSNWTTFSNKVKSHSLSPTHCKCALEMKSFLDAHSGVQPTIDTSLDKRRSELYELNCKRLDAIIDCIIMCGQQNIALRGHRDSGNDSSNKGNFKANS